MSSDPNLRPLATHADYSACVALQRATWGATFRELVPPAMLMISQKTGGILAGAFDGEHMAGFVFGVTGPLEGRLTHWSHMLAVDAAWRDRGIGRRLKEYQRDRVRDMGVERMCWTFDPLVARNAHFNLSRLRVRIVEYQREMYGDDPDSAMDTVIGTDRFVVEWDLADGPADRTGGPTGRRTDGTTDRTDRPTVGRTDGAPAITPEAADLPDAPTVRIAIPHDIHELKRHDPDLARAWRAVTRRAFEHYLSRGYRVWDLETDPALDRSFYVVVKTT